MKIGHIVHLYHVHKEGTVTGPWAGVVADIYDDGKQINASMVLSNGLHQAMQNVQSKESYNPNSPTPYYFVELDKDDKADQRSDEAKLGDLRRENAHDAEHPDHK